MYATILSIATLMAISLANKIDVLVLNRTGILRGTNTHHESGLMGSSTLMHRLQLDTGKAVNADYKEIDELEYLAEDDTPLHRDKRALYAVLPTEAPTKTAWEAVTLRKFNGEIAASGDEVFSIILKEGSLNEKTSKIKELKKFPVVVELIHKYAKYLGLAASDFQCGYTLLKKYGRCVTRNYFVDLTSLSSFWKAARILSAVRMPIDLSDKEKRMDGRSFAFGATFLQNATNDQWSFFARSNQHIEAHFFYYYIKHKHIAYCHTMDQYERLLLFGTVDDTLRKQMAKELLLFPPSRALVDGPCKVVAPLPVYPPGVVSELLSDIEERERLEKIRKYYERSWYEREIYGPGKRIWFRGKYNYDI